MFENSELSKTEFQYDENLRTNVGAIKNDLESETDRATAMQNKRYGVKMDSAFSYYQ